MMKNNIYKILIISLSALTLLSSCEKGFLDKYPSGTLVESNAFMTYGVAFAESQQGIGNALFLRHRLFERFRICNYEKL